MECPESVGRFRDETIPEKYGITYDSIPMTVGILKWGEL